MLSEAPGFDAISGRGWLLRTRMVGLPARPTRRLSHAACKRTNARCKRMKLAGIRRPSIPRWRVRSWPVQRRLSARHVNFLGALGNFREHDHAIRQHFGIALHHRQISRIAAFAIGQNADAQLRDQRRVPGQNAEVAFFAGHLDRLHGLRAARAAPASRSRVRCFLVAFVRVRGSSGAYKTTPSPPSSPPSRELLRSCPPCRTPARADRRACLRRFP